MGFIAKGSNIIVNSGGGSSLPNSFLYKVQQSDGSFTDESWGTNINDFIIPITNSLWTTYNGYKYNTLGYVQKIYAEQHTLNRNTRYDSDIRVEITPTPATFDTNKIKFITAILKGAQNASTSTIIETLIDEYLSGSYTNVLAIDEMDESIPDYVDVSYSYTIKEFKSVANCVKDYILPTTEALYLVNIAIVDENDTSSLSSLSLDIYQQYFIEFLGQDITAPGSIGRTEINPMYKPERAISNHIIVIDDDYILIDQQNNTKTLLILPNEAVQLDNYTIYYIYIDSTQTGLTDLSLGYWDDMNNEYVAYGTNYDLVHTGTITQQPCVATIIGTNCYIAPLIIPNGNNIQF